MSSPSSRERLGLLLGFVGMAIFGGTLPATRIAVAEIDPIALTSMRTAIARNTLDYDPRLMLLTIPGYCEGWFKPGKVFSQESDICGK